MSYPYLGASPAEEVLMLRSRITRIRNALHELQAQLTDVLGPLSTPNRRFSDPRLNKTLLSEAGPVPLHHNSVRGWDIRDNPTIATWPTSKWINSIGCRNERFRVTDPHAFEADDRRIVYEDAPSLSEMNIDPWGMLGGPRVEHLSAVERVGDGIGCPLYDDWKRVNLDTVWDNC
ncbi:MAG: hypothetical protein S4CHLAM102_08660 [Chlamydiia bacterium]|nr:hypothetical protein [Chlamydiia bacterium]